MPRSSVNGGSDKRAFAQGIIANIARPNTVSQMAAHAIANSPRDGLTQPRHSPTEDDRIEVEPHRERSQHLAKTVQIPVEDVCR